ncbi:unnamed protein product [Mytilus coruscus]|uniref:G-protein coupled receptors family 1 profile domain-containing protein n=1 Tax=Mytilus coruscus TaxID=42192 RepID=A0A6J8BG43_MYTCO|nr:unnamed protein product [Mytilus coruscus]
MMLERILHEFIVQMSNTADNDILQHLCGLMIHLIAGTIVFSLIQTFLICLERLNATFAIPSKLLTFMTNNITIGICFLLTHLCTISAFIVAEVKADDQHKHNGCHHEFTMQNTTHLFFDVPNGILVCLITICYVVVIVRMKRHLNQLISVDTFSETQIKQRRKAIFKMRKNVITLSIIIVLTICGILPRTIYGLYSQSIGEPSSDIINITNNLLLLNPLFNPFVYVFRIQEFRNRLKCKCMKSNKVGNVSTETANQNNTKNSSKRNR